MIKSKGKTCMVEEPSNVKQLSLNHVCKIGLKRTSFSHYLTKLTVLSSEWPANYFCETDSKGAL
jgi:hypothetical protein